MGAYAEQVENEKHDPSSLPALAVGTAAAPLPSVPVEHEMGAAKGNPGVQEQRAQLLPLPDTPAQQHSSAGFSEWLRTERAKGDTFGYCLALVSSLSSTVS